MSYLGIMMAAWTSAALLDEPATDIMAMSTQTGLTVTGRPTQAVTARYQVLPCLTQVPNGLTGRFSPSLNDEGAKAP
jgi:hypothetical protein